ncbi:MAG: hypothetical protein EA350_12065 [Gemmatimonadales bacterium]|nr:MAG: hypothetical protein EA350_12065 [Gemmatimonadales bacterium]
MRSRNSPTEPEEDYRGILLQRVIRPGREGGTTESISAELATLEHHSLRLLPHPRDSKPLRDAAAAAGWETPHPLEAWAKRRAGKRQMAARGPVTDSLSLARAERTTVGAGVLALNRYVGKFKAWLRRFRGVAAANLQRYLDWYLAILTPDLALVTGSSRVRTLLVLASRSWLRAGSRRPGEVS